MPATACVLGAVEALLPVTAILAGEYWTPGVPVSSVALPTRKQIKTKHRIAVTCIWLAVVTVDLGFQYRLISLLLYAGHLKSPNIS